MTLLELLTSILTVRVALTWGANTTMSIESLIIISKIESKKNYTIQIANAMKTYF